MDDAELHSMCFGECFGRCSERVVIIGDGFKGEAGPLSLALEGGRP